MGQLSREAVMLLFPGHTLVWKNRTEDTGKIQSEVQWAPKYSPAHSKQCKHPYAWYAETIRNAAILQNAPTERIPYGITPSVEPKPVFFHN